MKRRANDVGTPQNGGEKEAGKGGAEFPPNPPSAPPALRSRAWGGKRLRCLGIKTSKQNNFQFLLRKIWRAGVKKLKENCFALLAEYRRVETLGGFLPFTAEIVAQKRFELRSVNATIQDFLKIWKRLCARSAPQGRSYARIFPYISGLNQRAGKARIGFFCPAGGGSWWRSHRSKNISLTEILKCFCFPIFSASCRRQENKASFNPALSAPKAQWPKATFTNLIAQTI